MKVIFFFGGMPHYLVALLNALCRKGIDVSVIVPDGTGKTIGKGVKMVNEGMLFKTIQLREYKAFYRKSFFKKVIPVLDSEKPDIIVLGWPYILSLFFYPWLLWFLKKKKIKIIFREIPFQVPPFNKAKEYFLNNPVYNENLEMQKSSGLVFSINQYVLNRIRKFYYSKCDATLNYCDKALEIQPTYGVENKKIFISYNTPDTSDLFEVKKKLESENAEVNHNAYRIIHVGRLIRWKRVDMLIRVVARLKRKYPLAELVIVGDGPEKENLEKEAFNLGIAGSVKWPGPLYKYEDLGKYFMASSVYVLAGLGGLSINEAMGFGKAVVCSVADGTEKKLVRQGHNGLFFKDGDEDSLYEQLDYLFSNPAKMKEFGRNSENIIREEVNLETVSEIICKAFNFVLNKN